MPHTELAQGPTLQVPLQPAGSILSHMQARLAVFIAGCGVTSSGKASWPCTRSGLLCIPPAPGFPLPSSPCWCDGSCWVLCLHLHLPLATQGSTGHMGPKLLRPSPSLYPSALTFLTPVASLCCISVSVPSLLQSLSLSSSFPIYFQDSSQ